MYNKEILKLRMKKKKYIYYCTKYQKKKQKRKKIKNSLFNNNLNKFMIDLPAFAKCLHFQ